MKCVLIVAGIMLPATPAAAKNEGSSGAVMEACIYVRQVKEWASASAAFVAYTAAALVAHAVGSNRLQWRMRVHHFFNNQKKNLQFFMQL